MSNHSWSSTLWSVIAAVLGSDFLVHGVGWGQWYVVLCPIIAGVASCMAVLFIREKGSDLTQSYDKNPFTDRKKKMWDHKNATKIFDYTTIADRIRTVSWGNDSHLTGVVKPVYGNPTFPLTTKAV